MCSLRTRDRLSWEEERTTVRSPHLRRLRCSPKGPFAPHEPPPAPAPPPLLRRVTRDWRLAAFLSDRSHVPDASHAPGPPPAPPSLSLWYRLPACVPLGLPRRAAGAAVPAPRGDARRAGRGPAFLGEPVSERGDNECDAGGYEGPHGAGALVEVGDVAGTSLARHRDVSIGAATPLALLDATPAPIAELSPLGGIP